MAPKKYELIVNALLDGYSKETIMSLIELYYGAEEAHESTITFYIRMLSCMEPGKETAEGRMYQALKTALDSNLGLEDRIKLVQEANSRADVKRAKRFITHMDEVCSVISSRENVEELEITKKILGKEVSAAHISEIRKVNRLVHDRPEQRKFSEEVNKISNFTCLMTGVRIKEILDACHIIPVNEAWNFDVSNGLLLRTDIHKLWDKNALLIDEKGKVTVREDIKSCPDYEDLPSKIVIPDYVNREYLRLRYESSILKLKGENCVGHYV